MSPRLSVVIPFHNVERYIADCLESIQRQTMRDFEVVMVDDGSEDSSITIAESYVAGDERFHIIRQDNTGLGPARNTGVLHASGEFLAFVDSDDIVPRHAYELMLNSLEETGSDFVAGDARRFNSYGVRESWAHIIPFAATRRSTHVSRFNMLAIDRMVWNKVFRREFWDRHGFEFPPILYEDYPVTIKAHVLASSVDVLDSVVYYWRERDGGDLSVTQRAAELANLEDRMASASMVLGFLDERAPDIKHVVVTHLLHTDLNALIAGIRDADDDDGARILDMARTLLASMDAASLAALPPAERLQNALVEQDRLAELREVIAHRRANSGRDRVIRRGWLRPRYFLDLPFLGDDRVGIPDEVYELPRDGFDLHARIDDLAWEDQQLTIRGRAAVGELEMTEKSKLDVWLQTPEGDEVRYRTRRYPVMRHTGRVEHAGFEFSVPLERLKSGGQWLAKDWTLFAAVCCGRERRSGPVHRVMPGRALWATYQEVQAGTWVVPQLLPSGVFALRVRLVAAVVDEVARSHDTVTLGGTFAGQQAAGDVAVVVSRPGLPARRVVTDVRQSRRGCRFRATLDLRDLAGRADYDDPLAQSTRWQVRLEVDGEQRPLGVHPDFAQPDFEIGARSVSFVRNARANLVVIESQRTAIVSRVAWVAPGVLRIEAHQVPSGERTRKLVMRAVLPGRVAVERRLRVEQGDEWFADVDVRELVRSADDAADQTVLTPVQIVWRLAFEADDKPVPLRARPPLFERLPPAVRLDDRDVLVESYRRESLQVVVRRRSASGAGG